jgi:hypothetical protein
VKWRVILPTLMVLYFAAAAVGRAVTPPGRPWRPVFVLLTVATVVAGVAFVVAVGFSRYYWGYFLSRPAPDRRIVAATRLFSATGVHTTEDDDDTPRFVVDVPQNDLDSRQRLLAGIDDGNADPYYDLDSRVPRALVKRGLLPPAGRQQLPPETLARLYARLAATGRVDFGGYPGPMAFDGVVIEAASPSGEPLLFVGVTSGAVSNDHHAYYEFLFDESPGRPAGSPPISVRKFYYDVAGMEGVEWPTITLVLGVLGGAVVLPITLLVMAVRRWREHRRSGAQGFPVQLA